MTLLPWPEWVGYLAASLVLLTFFMRQMVPLRSVALAASLAWLTYGLSCRIYPVVALHSVLLLLNGYRLAQLLREHAASDPRAALSDLAMRRQRPTDAGLRIANKP